MRRPRTAVLLALAALVLAPRVEAAPRQPRTIRHSRSCPEFNKSRAGEDGLRFELHNTCKLPVACELSWTVRCRGGAESPGERSAHFDLAVDARDGVVASGSACGDAGWEIDGVRWTCQAVRVRPSDDGEP